MRRWTGWAALVSVAVGLALVVGSLVIVGGDVSAPKSAAKALGLSKIGHITFIIQENHSFESYFGRFPGADGATTGRTSTGSTVRLLEAPDQGYPDIAHGAADAAQATDHGRMDAFDRLPGAITLGVNHAYAEM